MCLLVGVCAIGAAVIVAAFAPAAVASKKPVAVLGTAASGSTGGLFNAPRDIAVNQATGQVYVVEQSNHRVQRFSAAGDFERAWGADVDTSVAGTNFEICTVAASCKAGVASGGNAGDNLRNGALNGPNGIDVDQDTGDVYVLDRTNRRVNQYDADGVFVRSWGFDVDATTAGTGFEVCPATDVCKAGSTVAGSAPGQFGSAGGAAKLVVSPGDGNPATGSVFVVDPGNRRVQRFNLDGTLHASQPVVGSATDFPSSNPQHVALDAAGILYVWQTLVSGATNTSVIARYDTNANAFLEPLNVRAYMDPSAGLPGIEGLEVDPFNGHLLVVNNQGASGADTLIMEFAAPGSASPTLVESHWQGSGSQSTGGLGVHHTASVEVIYVALGNRVVTLSETGVPATVSPVTASETTAHTTTLSGTVTPNGPTGFAASYRFEVSDDGANWTPVSSDVNVGDGDAPVAVQVAATGLKANTSYRVRLVVTKALGAGVTTSVETIFVTDALAPDVATLAPSNVRASAASLQGTVNPNGSPTAYHFEYGTTTGYGSRLPANDASAGSGGVVKDVSQGVEGLSPNTVYHYRLVAENALGQTVGADRSFTTTAAVSAAPGRAYELVTPAAKASGPGVGGHGGSSGDDGEVGAFSGLAADTGDRFIAGTNGGPVLAPGASVYVDDAVLSERGPDGWRALSAYNRPNYAADGLPPFLSLRRATGDLSRTIWKNPGGTARLFPEMEAGFSAQPVYSRDWAGAWDLLQPTDVPSQVGGQGGAGSHVSLAENGSSLAFSAGLRGLLGAGDPSLDQVPGAFTAYLVDTATGLSDSFAGRGPDDLLAACSGSGAERTMLPDRLPSGKLGARPCSAPSSGRDEALVDLRGSSIVSVGSDTPSPRAVSDDGRRAFFVSPDPTVGSLFPSMFPTGNGVDNCISSYFDLFGTFLTIPATGDATSCPAQLYVRQENSDGSHTTRWISRSAVADQDASLTAPVMFEGASADGDKVFFRTASPLVEDDPNGAGVAPPPGGVVTGTASQSSVDLYMYDFPDAPGSDPGAGTLTRISAGPLGAADANISQATARGTALRSLSADGNVAYFVTAEALPGVADPGNGTITSAQGSPATNDAVNLYMYDATRAQPDRWRFIARLPRGTGTSIAACASTGTDVTESRAPNPLAPLPPNSNCMRGTADGKLLSFWTTGRLTADDPADGAADMYAYDADSDTLHRISAPQGGAGGTYDCATGPTVAPCNGDGGFGILGVTAQGHLRVARDPEDEHEKIVFFQSKSRLVPGDTDDHMDVYEWRNGNLSLISAGIDDADAFYSGNSATGRDVFIVTTAALTWDDIDAVRDVYDVRVGGGFDPPPPVDRCDPLVGGGCPGPGDVVPTIPPTATAEVRADGNIDPGARPMLRIAGLSAKARRRAARRGVVPLRVRTAAAGRVRAVARALVRTRRGARARRVARDVARARSAGTVTVRLRLNRVVRRMLRSGSGVRLVVRVDQPGARVRSMRILLRRAGR
jgi:hypothetical protein